LQLQPTAANRHVNCKAAVLSALQLPQRLCRKTLAEIFGRMKGKKQKAALKDNNTKSEIDKWIVTD
jgi:hypothetical protein